MPAVATMRALAVRFVRAVRPEEWILLALWVIGAGLCLSSGTGFSGARVFDGYTRYFSNFIVLLFVVSRLLPAVIDRWEPRLPQTRRLRRFFFGEARGLRDMLRADVELMRGMLLFFVNLSVYSNVKVRIHAINGGTIDPQLAAVDDVLFGENFAYLIERWVSTTPEVRDYLVDTYMHGYFWMIALVFVAYLRRDTRSIRWIFTAIALTYVTAILISATWPTYGPFFTEPERFEWLSQTSVGNSHRTLRRVYNADHALVAAGQPIVGRTFVGIAAFPSLHVGHMVVMLVIAVRILPIYAWIMGVVLTATFLATVAFGWHFATDAIGGTALAIACTELINLLIRRSTPAGSSSPAPNSAA
jgi:hypothetical protein